MDKKLKILLDKVNESDPNLNTMDRNTRIRAGNYQFPFSGQQMDYLLLTLAKKLSEEDVLVFSNPSDPETVLTEITKYQLDDPYRVSIQDSSINGIVEEVLGSQILKASVLVIEGGSTEPISYLRCADSTGTAVYFASITKSLKVSVLTYQVSTRNLTQAFVDIVNSEGIANSLYQYLGFTEEELTTEQFKNGLKNAILAYKDGPIA
jgi:hypothetical protein